MPVSPDYAAGLAKEVLTLYTDAEERLLARIASRLAQGITDPNWADQKLLQIQQLRAEAETIIRELEHGSRAAIERAVRMGYNRGVAGAGTDLRAAGSAEGIAFGRVNERAVNALARAASDRVEGTHLRIRRSTVDIYQGVVQQAAGQVVTGVETRINAARAAMDRYARSGITGFIDKSGRSWDLASYAEMSTRTAAAQASVQGHLDKLVENGEDLVIVSDAPEECELCAPFEGEVLSISGDSVGEVTGEDLDGNPVTVTVEYSMDDAIAEGLFHPNCRHSTELYQIGITEIPTDTRDAEGDQLRQEQRSMERSVRAAKKDEAVNRAMHAAYDGPRPNPFTAAVKASTAKRQAAQERLTTFIADNDRKALPYRTSLVAR